MSWTSADISVEIDAMTRLLQARPGVIDLEDKLCNSLKNKLKSILNIEASALVQIYDTARSANLPDRIRQEILSTLDGMAVGEVLGPQCVGKVVASSQDCKTFHKYLTAKDISALQSASMWEGCDILASRLRLLGVEGMKESLKRLCCGILVWLEREKTQKLPHPDLVYNLSKHMMQALQTSPTEIPEKAMKLAKYPDDPQGMNAQHFAAAYKDEKPAKMDFPGLAALLNPKTVPVRNSSSSVNVNKEP